ncbi:MAG: sugar transferase [Alistipes sp.]|jgi:undecaprenyl-phosphate galactose phosphotransferase|uniref:sugar transferase n=1 Tax=Alistipes TaxID=239759 RepID=UPI0022E36A75|nr:MULTISPECIES: sugar transferase [Alistipes]MBS5554793.1 sugar transferase [Alistipes sp.]
MYRHFFKRLIDIVSALILLPLVLLVIFIMTFIIRIDDNGPVFYNAKRMGRNGKPFKMFKLRSMKVNAPDLRNADGSTFNSDHDPRVTRTGRFMRKTSIDEIPQILNVLKGDMSFIGPRPVLANKPYTEYDEIRRKRLTVRPGITGYSQAFFRNSITQDEKFQYDCYYVDHLTFRLDVKILFVTVYSVLRRKNINTEHS